MSNKLRLSSRSPKNGQGLKFPQTTQNPTESPLISMGIITSTGGELYRPESLDEFKAGQIVSWMARTSGAGTYKCRTRGRILWVEGDRARVEIPWKARRSQVSATKCWKKLSDLEIVRYDQGIDGAGTDSEGSTGGS